MTKKETMECVIEAARATYQNEGFIEIDDNAMPSVGEPPDDGVYVQAWVWVGLSDMDGVTEEDLKGLNSMHRYQHPQSLHKYTEAPYGS